MSEATRDELLKLWARGGCANCRHFDPGKVACAAFPQGIPADLIMGEGQHVDPVEGDRGVRFEPKPTEA